MVAVRYIEDRNMKDTLKNTEAKRQAGAAAATLAEKGMRVGLGTGSTAAFAIEELGRRNREEGLELQCVATSFQSALLAAKAGLPLLASESVSRLDLSIDGADEIDPERNLIKGGGAAHTREKIVHSMSERFVVVADDSKLVSRLGEGFGVPVEFLLDSRALVESRLVQLGAKDCSLRMAAKKDGPVITDNGLLIFDVAFDEFLPSELESAITAIPGVLECGIFAKTKPQKGDCLVGSGEGIRKL